MTILCIVFSSCVSDIKNETDSLISSEKRKEDTQDIKYDKKFIEDFYYKKGIYSWWEIVAIKSAGGEIPPASSQVLAKKKSILGEKSQGTDYAGYILGSVSAETFVNTQDIIVAVKGLTQIQDKEDGSFGAINSHIWAMIALDVVGGEYCVDGALTHLLSQQREDGSWSYNDTSDPDMTGMALIALSNHIDKEGVSESIERAVEYLEKSQLSTGGFESYGKENINSVATVISGLVAVGEDVKSAKWSQNGNNLLDALMKFQLEDGSFSYLLSPKKYNQMATYQAFIAIFDAQKNESIWHKLRDNWIVKTDIDDITDIKDVEDIDDDANVEETVKTDIEKDIEANVEGQSKKTSKELNKNVVKEKESNKEIKSEVTQEEKGNPNTAEQIENSKKDESVENNSQPPKQGKDNLAPEQENKISVQVQVIGYGGKVFYRGTVCLNKKNANAFTALKATGLRYKAWDDGSYVTSIEGESEFTHGATSGWKYKVNGTIPNVAAIDYGVKEGDKVEWWYALTVYSTGPGE